MGTRNSNHRTVWSDRATGWRQYQIIVILAAASAAMVGGLARAEDNAGRKKVSVEAVQPVRRTVTQGLTLPGTLMADERVELFAKTSGYVDTIDLDIGARVRKGDELVTISVPEMADELRQSEAVVRAKQSKVKALKAKSVQAQRLIDTAVAQVQRFSAEHDLEKINLRRTETLREGNAIPEQALDKARSDNAITEAQLRIAEAQVAGARAEFQAVSADVDVAKADAAVAAASVARLKTLMNYATIRAPFDGVITHRHVDHGTFVRSAAEGVAQPLLRVAKTDRIRVVIEIPESDTPFVRAGTNVKIELKTLGDATINGVISRTAASIKPETRTMRAEVDLDNADGRLTPGMYALVTVLLDTRANATVVPSKAIRTSEDRTVVYLVVNGKAEPRPVEIGYDDGIWAEILSGLSSGDQVIIAADATVASGVAVEIATTNPS